MWVLRNYDKLIKTLYTKDTDHNTLLLATSFHPTSLKKRLPKSQFYRLRRICYSDKFFIVKSKIMKNTFLDRGYPSEWIEEAFNSTFHKTCSELLKNLIKRCFYLYYNTFN